MFQRRPLSGQGHSQFELATLHLSATHQVLNFTLRCNSDMLQKFTDSHIEAVFIELGGHGCSPWSGRRSLTRGEQRPNIEAPRVAADFLLNLIAYSVGPERKTTPEAARSAV